MLKQKIITAKIRHYFQAMIFIASLITLPAQSYALNKVEMYDTFNHKHQLSEYIGKGKWVVLNIWATRCPPCREEIPELVFFNDAHKDSDAIVVGIAIDFPSYGYANEKEVKAFMKDNFFKYPVLLSDAMITQDLGLGRLSGLPTTFMFTPEGNVAGMQVGGITKEILEAFIRQYNKEHPGKNNHSKAHSKADK